MMRRMLTIALLALAGCSADQGSQEASAGGPSDAYHTELPMKDLMSGVIQHAAEGVWNRTGYLMDDEGFHTMFPQNEEEWHDAKVAGQTVAELTNVLMLPGRRVDAKEWDQAVMGVRNAALKAAKAAEEMNEDRFMDASLEMNSACQFCHEIYDPTA